MTKLSKKLDAAAAAALAYVLATSPALAAFPFDVPVSPGGVSLREWILGVSLVLLAVALALRMMRRRGADTLAVEGPDLRWWRNP